MFKKIQKYLNRTITPIRKSLRRAHTHTHTDACTLLRICQRKQSLQLNYTSFHFGYIGSVVILHVLIGESLTNRTGGLNKPRLCQASTEARKVGTFWLRSAWGPHLGRSLIFDSIESVCLMQPPWLFCD